jgi:hypothetical protein
MKKTVSVLTLLCLIASLAFSGVYGAFAEDVPLAEDAPLKGVRYDDIGGHWAENSIDSWSERNIINGFDGKFRPDDSITRGETAVILDRIMKFESEADNIFSDLDQNFYTSAMLKANKAGVILGDGGLLRPNDAVTLQETAVMFSRAFEIADGGGGATEFDDDGEIAGWARGYINAMIKADYLHGADGRLNPEADISRAQVITILDNMYKSGQKTLAEKINGGTASGGSLVISSGDGGGRMPGGGGSGGGSAAPESSVSPSLSPSLSPSPPAGGEDENLGGGGGGEEDPENGITVTTSLTDGAIQKGSKKTFDVWASDKNGDKITPSVTLNGEDVPVNWDDSEKTSFTLIFSAEGENTVAVTAVDSENKSKSVTYSLTYQKAEPGDVIGTSVWSFEAFAIGMGYIIPPRKVDIIEGETSAQTLDRVVRDVGFDYEYSGTLTSGFYLSFINEIFVQPEIPSVLAELAARDMDEYDGGEYSSDKLGEFDFTNGSGWMYSVNNVFPNVGFADTYLSDGDVVRVQYTLTYGMDIGGYGALGNSNGVFEGGGLYFESPNRDALTAKIAEKGYENCNSDALTLAEKIDATAVEINTALGLL